MSTEGDPNVDMSEQLVAQVLAEAEGILAGRNPADRRHPVRIHRGDTVTLGRVDRSYTSAFAHGYAFATAWFAKGAPVQEASELCSVYHLTKPGGPAEESSHWLDATMFPSLVAHLGGHLEVHDGAEVKAEYVAGFGEEWNTAYFPARAFCWPSCSPLYDAFLLCVFHVTEG